LRHVLDRQELIWHGLSLIETVALQPSCGRPILIALTGARPTGA
jgi:hypothetical protein